MCFTSPRAFSIPNLPPKPPTLRFLPYELSSYIHICHGNQHGIRFPNPHPGDYPTPSTPLGLGGNKGLRGPPPEPPLGRHYATGGGGHCVLRRRPPLRRVARRPFGLLCLSGAAVMAGAQLPCCPPCFGSLSPVLPIGCPIPSVGSSLRIHPPLPAPTARPKFLLGRLNKVSEVS